MTEDDVLLVCGDSWRPLREVQDELAAKHYGGDWKPVSDYMKTMKRNGLIRYKRTGNSYSVRALKAAQEKVTESVVGVEEMIVVRALLNEISRLCGDRAQKVIWDYFNGKGIGK